jgi:hypothetical protein
VIVATAIVSRTIIEAVVAVAVVAVMLVVLEGMERAANVVVLEVAFEPGTCRPFQPPFTCWIGNVSLALPRVVIPT